MDLPLEPCDTALKKIDDGYIKKVFKFLKKEIKSVATANEFLQVHSIV